MATERMRDHETAAKVLDWLSSDCNGSCWTYLLLGGPIGKKLVFLHHHGCCKEGWKG